MGILRPIQTILLDKVFCVFASGGKWSPAGRTFRSVHQHGGEADSETAGVAGRDSGGLSVRRQKQLHHPLAKHVKKSEKQRR